ncbi:YqhA family protein [Pontibacter sp. JAM-7]|uniref:YqhA family protein n=1 Tax=Pontibacter sp. JAM-7 TaxID=3366581 RepID=UPI003AF85D37
MKLFERTLWSSRWLMIPTVVAVIVSALPLIGFVISDLVHLVAVLLQQGFTQQTRVELLFITVEIVDQSLMAGVMIMFGLGIYEIFIGKIMPEKSAAFSSKLLVVTSIAQLKSKLGTLVIMILIVKFLSLSIEMSIQTPMDLLMYAASVALLGLALFLTNSKVLGKPAERDKQE